MKKNYTPIIIGLLLLSGVILAIVLLKDQPPNNDTPDMVEVLIYDANGNPLSVVNSVSGVYYIGFRVNIVNTGTKALTCNLIDNKVNGASDTNFNTQMATIKATPLYVPVGTTKSWTTPSGLAVSGYEPAPTPDVFNFVVKCSYLEGTETKYLSDKTGSVSVKIESEGTAGFDVTTETGGIGLCGNSICDSGEDTSNCPVDCSVAPPTTTVKFRTTDTLYPSNSAIGVRSSCSSGNLIGYGRSGSTCFATTSVTCPSSYAGYILVGLANPIPGGPSWRGSNFGCLYSKGTDSTIYAVAWKVASSGSPCGVSGQYGVLLFDSDSAYASSVDTNPVSKDPLSESLC